MLSELQTNPMPVSTPVPADQSSLDLPAAIPHRSFQAEMGRVSRQSGIVFAGTIFTAVLAYIFKIYLARVLGASALGIYALGMTIIGFLGIGNVLGLPDAAMRFVAQYAASENFAALRSLLWKGAALLLTGNLVFGALLLEAGPWIATHFYHSPQLIRYLPLFAAIMITGALSSFFGKVVAGYKEVGQRTMITHFISSPLTMAVAVVLIALGGGLRGYLVAQVLASVVVLALLVGLSWRLTPVAARSLNLRKVSLAPEVWSFSAAMFGIRLMEFVMSQSDRVALGYFRGAREVGIYSLAAAVIAYETVILQSVNQIFAPVIADLHTRGEKILLGRMFQTLTKWMLGLTLPLAMVAIVFARPVMRIFGHDFAIGWPILIVGTLGQLVNCGVGSVGFLLLMSGHQRRLIRVQAVMAVVMVGLSLCMVPLWGAWGAALAAAATNIGVNLWNLVEVKSTLRLSPYNRSYMKLLPPLGVTLLTILLMSRASIFLRVEAMNLVLTLALAYAVFVASAFSMGLDADDRLIAEAVWSRVRQAFGR